MFLDTREFDLRLSIMGCIPFFRPLIPLQVFSEAVLMVPMACMKSAIDIFNFHGIIHS